MELEEMQVIWNEQNNEKMYAINEEALYGYIKGKGRSVKHWLELLEWMMIAVNLVLGILLTLDTVQDSGPVYQYVLSGMYIAYALFSVFWRLARKREEVHFPETMLGELDKAIWRIDYLIQQGRSIINWYLLPLLIVASLVMVLNQKPVLALVLLLVVLPGGYLGARWEVRKFHLPKKRSLEALRETLTSSSS